MPLSKETHHLTLEADADLDIGETKKTPAFYAEAFKKAVGEPDWVPQDIDMDEEITAGQSRARATRFWVCALDLWLPRCLATIGRLWKRMGFEIVQAALRKIVVDGHDQHRTQAVLDAFTRPVFDKIVAFTYLDHLDLTAYAFCPGRYLCDSRTKALHTYVLDTFDAADLVAGPAFCKLLVRLCVLGWAVLQLRPEVAAHLLEAAALDDLVDPFLDAADPDPSYELIKYMRELWAEAPVNGTRADILAEVAAHVRSDKGCFCKPGSGCELGRAAQLRHVGVFTQRAQPPAYHLASKLKDGVEQTTDEARYSAMALAGFVRDQRQMAALVKAAGDEGGEQDIVGVVHSRKGKGSDAGRDLGIYLIANVRATMFGRLLFSSVQHLRLHIASSQQRAADCQKIAIPGDPTRYPHLADEPTKRVLAFVTSPSLGGGLKPKERIEIVSAVLAHSDHQLPCGERLVPKLAKAFSEYMVRQTPELKFVLPILMEEMGYAFRWNPSSTEEVPCEMAKLLLGRSTEAEVELATVVLHRSASLPLPRPHTRITGSTHAPAVVKMGLATEGELLRGRYHTSLAAAHVCGLERCEKTPTQMPAVPCSVHRCLAMYKTEDDVLMLRRGVYLPRMDVEPVTATAATLGLGRASATGDAAEAGADRNAQLRHALANLRRARRLLDDANQARAAAADQVTYMERHLQSLQDSADRNLAFIDLRDRLCHRAPDPSRLAYHIWAACTGSGKWTCGLHLDDLDLGLLLNLICSFGVSKNNEVVRLRGSLLMIVLAVSTACLAAVDCGELQWAAPAAHDEAGNIIMLEPSITDVELPADGAKADIPTTEAAVLSALREGRCVLGFFRSGGVFAGQLGHHWHLVTCMDPQDIVDGTVRIGAIAYPQRNAIVSATALQAECSKETSAALAAVLQCEAQSKGKDESPEQGKGEDVSRPKAHSKRKVRG